MLSCVHYQIWFYEASLGRYNWLDPRLGPILLQNPLYSLSNTIVSATSGIMSYFADRKYVIQGLFRVAGPTTN